MSQQPLSIEIAINIVLGIISWLIAIAGVVATVRYGRQQRHRQDIMRGPYTTSYLPTVTPTHAHMLISPRPGKRPTKH